MCRGTDAAADCTAGRCRFQEEVEEQARRDNDARLRDEAEINEALEP
jgi:hypothetical protein